jgi:hypothetical protein
MLIMVSTAFRLRLAQASDDHEGDVIGVFIDRTHVVSFPSACAGILLLA